MVKVGDTFKCDKITLVGKEKATPTMYGCESKSFSKGVFTLLDLGPPPWRNVWYDHYVKAKDCNGTEGWIDIKDFDSYKRGYKYSPDGIIKRWMSSDQLKQGRSERDETQRKETERVEQEKRKQKEKENQKEASSSTASILLPHLKPRDRTASGGSTSRDLGIGKLNFSRYGKMRAIKNAFFVFVRKSYGIPSFADFTSSKPRDLTPSSNRIIIIKII